MNAARLERELEDIVETVRGSFDNEARHLCAVASILYSSGLEDG
jgi:hypothetical protein